MKLKTLIWLFLLFSQTLLAADVESLKRLFDENYNRLYQHGMCGKNIERLLQEARRDQLDLSGSYVLKIEGAGFLETSGFFSRHNKNNREMLGYFHVVLVADGVVFDFDLADRLTPMLEHYVRLQFTPPYEPFFVFGIGFESAKELPWWQVTRYEWKDYLSQTNRPNTAKKKLGDVVNLQRVFSLPRIP
jgi:hypothetical protein